MELPFHRHRARAGRPFQTRRGKAPAEGGDGDSHPVQAPAAPDLRAHCRAGARPQRNHAAHPAGGRHLAQVRGQGAGRRHPPAERRDGLPLRVLVPRRGARGLRAAPARLHDRRPDPVHARRRGGGGMDAGRSHRGRVARRAAASPDVCVGRVGTASGCQAARGGRQGGAQALSSPGPLEWKGEGVTIAQVLDALTDFRNKFARAQVPDDDHPHPRNTVMTLIAVAATEAEEKRAISESTAIAMHHPSLVIVVRDQAEVKEGRIGASIAAPLIPAESRTDLPAHYAPGALHVRGAAASHLAALVDPLLVSGVPTNIWWLGTPPFGSHELRDALQVADALVVDSARFARPYHSFLGLADTIAHAHKRLGMADLQWARLDPWRGALAQVFAPVALPPLPS